MNSDALESVESMEKGPLERRPYQTPVLRCYGDVGVLTQNVGNTSGTADGGVVNTKTQ